MRGLPIVLGCGCAAMLVGLVILYQRVDQAPAAMMHPRLLLIIQGGYRTLDLTVDSILRNLCLVNNGCHVILSLANDANAVSGETRIKLEPYLVGELYRDRLKDVHHPHYIFEYHQTLKVFASMPHLVAAYDYVIRIRADCYISTPIPLLSAVGQGTRFARDWDEFARHLLPAQRADGRQHLLAWLFAAGVPRMIPKLRDPTPMAWSPMTSFEFNKALVHDIMATLPNAPLGAPHEVAALVRHLVAKHRIVYLSGGLFLHFGPIEQIRAITQSAFDYWAMGAERNPLSWRTQFPHWTKQHSQEANIRLTHRKLGYAMIDINNWSDYLVSFSWKYYGYTALTQARGLMCWLLRERQVKFKVVVPRIASRMWEPLDNASFTRPPQRAAGGREMILTHGCLSDSTPAEMADCFEGEESL
jgi:hypothetical protein